MRESIKFMRSVVLYSRTYGKEKYTLGTVLEQMVLLRLRLTHNFRIRMEYRDEGFSGKRFNRPAFEEMMEYIKCQKRDRIRYLGVVNWRVLSTDRKEYEKLRKSLKSQGVKIITLNFRERTLLKQQI